ncbi:MAG: hypothetical protein PUK79_08490, partial [Clostridiales bacterium]|nr:hypothetical protein [Clostridiales bacterium]
MWLPALFAFALRFTLSAEYCALAAMMLLTLASVFSARKRAKTPAKLTPEDRSLLKALVCLALPLTLLSAYLQYTHTLREVDGTLHVGQSTYGDLCMHLSIATSLRGSALPADYNILPGTTLGYPILTDATATTMLLFGASIQAAMIVPAAVMSALVYCGYLIFAREVTRNTPAAVVAAVLLFFNGGLGFLYDFDLSGHDFSKITEIFTGYYKTPANQPEYNLRWSNLVCDLLLPQRTFLGGWTLLLPALYFARSALRRHETRDYLLATLFASALPMVHTHSFAALGLYCAGSCVYQFVADPENRRKLVRGAGMFLGLTLVCALPQMISSTLKQATREGFVRLHFNWVNYTDEGFVDFYPWFWAKNIGLPLLAMICALLEWKKRDRMDFVGAACIFVVAELVLFQPLDYDNNKLFYIWYLLMLPAAGSACVGVWRRLRGTRSRALLAALFLAGSTLSGALSIARECVSDYQLFSAADVAVAEYIEENTDPDDMFLTGLHHNNPVYALAGRDVVCGPSLFLYWHGLDYMSRDARVRAFYADPENNLDLLREYNVKCIVSGSAERYELNSNEEALDALFELIYDEMGTKIYRVAL